MGVGMAMHDGKIYIYTEGGGESVNFYVKYATTGVPRRTRARISCA